MTKLSRNPESSVVQQEIFEDSLLNPILTKTNIPALFLPSKINNNKLIVYFHANAEDIGLTYPLLEALRNIA